MILYFTPQHPVGLSPPNINLEGDKTVERQARS